MDYNTFIRLTLKELYLVIDGYRLQSQIEASNFRSLYALYFNSKTKKGHQKPASRLWKLPLLDGDPFDADNLFTMWKTKEGCIEYLENVGFTIHGEWEDIPESDIKELRRIFYNKVRYKSERKEAIEILQPILEKYEITLPKKIRQWQAAH